MVELRKGLLAARIATAVGYLANVYLKSTELVDIQVRLTALEERNAKYAESS